MSSHKNITNKTSNRYNDRIKQPPIVPAGNQTIDVSQLDSSALSDLATRLNAAIQSKSTSFNMSVAEAGAVFAAITDIIKLNADLNQTVYELQNQVLKDKVTVTKIVADAGGFK